MTDTFDESQAYLLIGTAEKMIQLWNRLSAEKQTVLLKRFGTKDKALAALVASQIVSAPAP